MTITSKQINTKYRHKYHLMPEYGWMNDPNGFSFFNNEYHLFYQHYPYDTVWGPMHWAHAVSSDLIKWSHKEIALKPDKEYDRNGVFSGSAIQVGDEHWLYYTGHVDLFLDKLYDKDFIKKPISDSQETDSYIRQVQCLAKSADGLNYIKYENNPVISTEQIPKGIRMEDFRDPKVWRYKNKFYLVVGARSIDGIGNIIFYVSNDGIKWEFLNQFTLGKDYGTVWECPDLFELDGKYVLIFSPQDKPRVGNSYENVHSSMALIGSFNHGTGEFIIEHEQELDQGFDFYAPQSIMTYEGKRVIIAWMNMWERNYPLHELGHGWNGSMTLPRELSLENGKLVHKPYQKIEKYQQNKVEFNHFEINGKYEDRSLYGICQQIEVEFEMKDSHELIIEFFKGINEKLSLTFTKHRNEIILDRRDSDYPIVSLGTKNDYLRSQTIDLLKPISLNIFLDVSSIEIFVNNGEHVFTSLFFSKELGERVLFHSVGTTLVHRLLKWEIV